MGLYEWAKWGEVGSNGGEDQVIWKLAFTFLALVSTLGVNSLRIRVSSLIWKNRRGERERMTDSGDRFMESWNTGLGGSRLSD